MPPYVMIEAIKQVLMKWTDPKPEYTGMSAHELAKILLETIKMYEINNK